MRRRKAISHLNGQKIRCIWVKEKDSWFYSAIDFIGALGGTANPARYWSDVKRRQKIVSDELYANCVKFKLDNKDGKKRPSDMVTVEVLEKICMNLPVPEFTKMYKWLSNFRSKKRSPDFDFVVHQKPE